MLHTIWGHIAVDCCQLPAVFALDGAEQAADIGPRPTPRFTAGKMWHEPSFHLGQLERPFTNGLQGQFGRHRALLLRPLHDSTLHKACGIML